MKKAILTMFVTMFAVLTATQAFALTSKDLDSKMWVFSIVANSDGTLIDNNTFMLNARFSKSELKTALTAIDPETGKASATQIVSFGSISIYRFAGSDMLLHCIFDSAGISKYCYILPKQIEQEQE
jgi:hypothetical protein